MFIFFWVSSILEKNNDFFIANSSLILTDEREGFSEQVTKTSNKSVTLQISINRIFSGLLFYYEEQLLTLLEDSGPDCWSEDVTEYKQLSEPRLKELNILNIELNGPEAKRVRTPPTI